MSEAEWIAAGLYDPDAPDASERRSLLEYLEGLGLSADDIDEAAQARRISQLAADRILWGDSGPTLTAAEVARRARLSEPALRRIVLAAGLADSGDAPVFREPDVELFDSFGLGTALFGEEATLQFTRVLG